MNAPVEIIITRLVVILGIVNVVMALSIVLTCRCIPGLKITGNLMQYTAYRRFYKYHCYLWWVFWPSVIVHSILVIVFLGLPF